MKVSAESPRTVSAGNQTMSLVLAEEDAGLRAEAADPAHVLHVRLCRSGEVHLLRAGDSEAWPLRPAAAILVPAGTAVVWRVGMCWRRLSLRLEPAALQQLLGDASTGQSSPPWRAPAHDPVIEHYAALIQHELHQSGSLSEDFLGPMSRLIGQHVARAYLHPSSAAPLPMRLSAAQRERIDKYIHATLPAPVIIEQLAAACELSQYQLMRLMKRALGISPQQYVQERRIDLARKLLRESDLPLTEIAFELGFSSQSHFTSAFRALTGHTPKAYRDRHDLL